MASFIVTGVKELINKLQETIEEEDRKAKVALHKACIVVENEAKRSMSGQKSGRSYQVSKTGPLHVASRPGEPPAVLTGRLRASLAHRVSGKTFIPHAYTFKGKGEHKGGAGVTKLPEPEGGFHVTTAHVGTNVEYAMDLEKGKRKIAARPFMLPALEKSRNKILDIMKDELGFD